jgi:type VI secretion system protein ImpC
LVEVVDEVAAARMRAILHHPVFQALESAWRAVALLVRRLDTDGGLKLFLLDLRRDDLAEDLKATDLIQSRAARVLVGPRETPGGVPWAVLVGNYTFGPTLADGARLARLAHLARAAGAPLLASADPALVGCRSLAATPDPENWKQMPDPNGIETWQALRRIPATAYLGLALPRFLLRQPYGKEGSLSEEFPFEEMIEESTHEDYLWGNPAFACALLLGKAYERRGWRLRPGEMDEIEGLPTWVREVEGDRSLLPCAEVLLRDRAANVLMDHGLIPVQSVQGTDTIRVPQFVSLAQPTRGLAGRWKNGGE